MRIIPLRHTSFLFELGSSEQKACLQILGDLEQKALAQDSKVTGFSIGIYDGMDAGQTVMHCHSPDS
jgi:ATP adenylyltransferase